MTIQRNRIIYFSLVILTVFIGLGTRTSIIPKFIYPYLGDYFYAIMYYLIIGFLFPRWSSLKVAISSIFLCYTIEILQLYQADWINEIRKNRLGGLILGFGFLWSDMISYTLGGLSAYLIEILVYGKNKFDDQ